jgi:ADP-heptose:LPS heptosyltransferase
MEFYPPDLDRTRITRRLVEDLDWLGDQPLIIIHPGGASNPLETNVQKQWPSERFVRLGNYLAREYNARIVLVGAEADKELVTAVSGMMSNPSVNLAGQLSLGEIGALCEVADLYVGNDTGPTHVAAAVGCPTLAIFGPSDPATSKPYGTKGKVVALWKEVDGKRPFSWEEGVSVEDAIQATNTILKRS